MSFDVSFMYPEDTMMWGEDENYKFDDLRVCVDLTLAPSTILLLGNSDMQ